MCVCVGGGEDLKWILFEIDSILALYIHLYFFFYVQMQKMVLSPGSNYN